MSAPKETIAKFLSRIGISANFLTLLGLFFAFLSAGLVVMGSFFWAGASLLISGLCDLMDGAVARASGKVSDFGGIMDSTLDRYGDGAVFGALAIYFAYFQEVIVAGLALAALLGSFAVSYVRARAECEIESCRVGFWERGERLVYLSLALLLNNLFPALLILAVGTQWTAWQRLEWARRMATTSGAPKPPAGWILSRRSKVYALKAAFLIIVLFFRIHS